MFLLKVLVLVQLRDHPLLQPDAGLDTTAYVELARRVVAGDIGLGPGLYYVSPLYIYFLAGGLALVDSFSAIRVVQVMLGTAAVGFLFLTARRWFDERAAWSAGILAALTGLFTFYETLILQAAIDTFLTAAALLAFTTALTRPAGRSVAGWAGAAGVLFGLQTLNRPNIILAVIVVGGGLVVIRRFGLAAALAAGLTLGLAPVAIRNGVVSGQFSMVSSHGGLNFYIGNNEHATGFYHPVAGITPTIVGQEKDARRVAEQATGRGMTDAEVSSFFMRKGIDWAAAHPAAAAALLARKLRFVFHAQHIALPHSYPFYAYDSGTVLRFLFVGPWLLVPLGVVGLWVAAPAARRAEYAVWAAFVPGYALGVAAFFVAERYRLPLMAPLCVGAGAGISWLVRTWQSGERVRLAAPFAAFVLVAALVNWPTALHDGRWEEALRLAQRLVILGRYEEADAWVRRAEASEPRPGATRAGVGAQLLLLGEHDRARPLLEKALEAEGDGTPSTHFALGQALLRSGRAADAIPHLRRGFEAGIELPGGGYDLAAALHAAGLHREAAAAITRIRPPESEGAEGLLKLGRLAVQVQAPDVAEPLFRRAAGMRPDDAAVRQQLGLNLLVLRRYDEAAQELAAAARLDPRDVDTLARLAFCELKLGRLDQARAHTAAALALDPQDPLARQLAGELRLRQ